MNYFAKQKWQRFLIIGLLIMNVVTLVMVWVGRPNHPGPYQPGKKGHLARDMIVKELNLSKEQESKYEDLIKDHRRLIRDLGEKIRASKKIHLQLLGNSADTMASQRALQTIGATQMEIETATVEHFLALKAILTESQKMKFESIYQDALKMMARNVGPPPRKGPPLHH